MKIKLNYNQRKELLAKLNSGNFSVFSLAREYRVSRTLVYRFKRRAQKSAGLLVPGARRPRKPSLPVEIEGEVLDLALTYPELSSWKLSQLIKGKIKLGPHGVYTLLKRFHLNTYGERKRLSINYLERNRFPVINKEHLVHERRVVSINNPPVEGDI